jgi:tetratricopeptide (TPR) repeat protein
MQDGRMGGEGNNLLTTVLSASEAAATAMLEKRPLEAIGYYEAALRMPEAASDDVRAVLLGNLGVALLLAGQPGEACAVLRQAIELDPGSFLANRSLGDAYGALGDLKEAARAYERSIVLNPADWVALTRLGNVLMKLGRRDLAIPRYREAARLNAGNAGLLRNLGNALVTANALVEAEQVLTAALKLAPDSPEVLNSFGGLSLRLHRLAAAEAALGRAIELNPQSVETLNNLGTLEMRRRRFDRAAELYLRALAIQPESAASHYNLGLCCLQRGDYSRGWSEMEWRGSVVDGGLRRQKFAQPQWRGEPFDGATILLHAEQGFGDTIQFARYVSLTGERGKTILQVQPELARLMRQNLGSLEVLSVGDELPEFEWQCSLMSLPLAFGTTLETIPSAKGYLRADAEDVARMWAKWPRHPSKRRVGLVWSGNPGNRNDALRSIPLQTLMVVCEGFAGEVEFFSLQKGKAGELPAGSSLHDACRSCKDFADTAALIETLDLVIAVDTAVAHLAGALGKEVWVLLSDLSDWRWLEDREDSPWYGSARIFRQRVAGDWEELCERLTQALGSWCGLRGDPRG